MTLLIKTVLHGLSGRNIFKNWRCRNLFSAGIISWEVKEMNSSGLKTIAEMISSANGKVKFTTLDLPLLLGTKIGPNKLNLRFMAGPVVSFIIDENTTFATAYQGVSDFGNYKKQTLGLQAGTGVDLGNLTLDLRYEAGLSNVSQSEKYSQKQNLFHLSLGIKLL
jgi:hypothetical protein